MRSRNALVENLESRCLLSFGEPISSYGTDGGGTVVTLTTSENTPRELVVDSAGRTIAAIDSLLIRYRADGKLDTTFGNGGKLSAPAGTDNIVDVAVDGAGYVYVLTNTVTRPADVLLYRYNNKGRLDTAWAHGAFTIVARDTGIGSGQIAFAPGGKIVVAAATIDSSPQEPSHAFVARFDADGSVDKTFNKTGRVELTLSKTDATSSTRNDRVLDVAVVSGNKIVIVGGSEHVAIAKLNANGTFDRTFADGSGYWRRTDIAPASAFVNADGTFAFGGASSTDSRPIVMLFEADGSQRWTALAERQAALHQIFDIAPLPDGRVAVGGSRRVILNADPASLMLATASANGVISSAVETSLRDTAPGAGAELSTDANGSLFLAAANLREWDGQDPTQLVMMKVDASKPSNPHGLPNVFADVGDNDIVAYRDGSADLAYYDKRNRRLMYGHRGDNGFWSAAQVVDGHVRAGEHLAIAGETFGRPWIAYHDSANGDLKVAHRRADGSWSTTVVDSRGTTGRYISMTLIGAEFPQITYYDASKRDLRFASLGRGGTWTTQTIDAAGDTGRTSAIDVRNLRGVDVPAVAYTDAAGNINYAERRVGSTWTKSRVISTSNVWRGAAGHLDLAVVKQQQPVISFYDSHNGDLKLAYQPSETTWTTRTLASVGVEGLYNRVVSSRDNTVYVLSYNRSADRTTAFRLADTDLGGTIRRTTVATGFGTSLTIASLDETWRTFTASAIIGGYDSKLGAFRVLDGLLS